LLAPSVTIFQYKPQALLPRFFLFCWLLLLIYYITNVSNPLFIYPPLAPLALFSERRSFIHPASAAARIGAFTIYSSLSFFVHYTYIYVDSKLQIWPFNQYDYVRHTPLTHPRIFVDDDDSATFSSKSKSNSIFRFPPPIPAATILDVCKSNLRTYNQVKRRVMCIARKKKDEKRTRETRGYQKLLLAADAECKEETDATAAAGNQNFEFVPVPCD